MNTFVNICVHYQLPINSFVKLSEQSWLIVRIDMVISKMNELFDQKWMDDCWKTFVEYFKEAIR